MATVLQVWTWFVLLYDKIRHTLSISRTGQCLLSVLFLSRTPCTRMWDEVPSKANGLRPKKADGHQSYPKQANSGRTKNSSWFVVGTGFLQFHARKRDPRETWRNFFQCKAGSWFCFQTRCWSNLRQLQCLRRLASQKGRQQPCDRRFRRHLTFGRFANRSGQQ